VWAERRERYPLLDLGLFRERAAAAACLINALMGFALALAIASVPLFINTRLSLLNLDDPDILRRGAWDSGWVLSAFTLSMAVFSAPGGWLAARFRERLPALIGLAIAFGGYMLLHSWNATTGYPEMAAGLILAGMGLGLAISPVTTTVVNAADAGRRGSASALVITLRLVGMTLGVSALTLWGVQRQDALRRAGAADPLAASDPSLFLINVAAQVVDELFLFAAAACLLALLASLALRGRQPAPALAQSREPGAEN
jgi:MFS family permease